MGHNGERLTAINTPCNIPYPGDGLFTTCVLWCDSCSVILGIVDFFVQSLSGHTVASFPSQDVNSITNQTFPPHLHWLLFAFYGRFLLSLSRYWEHKSVYINHSFEYPHIETYIAYIFRLPTTPLYSLQLNDWHPQSAGNAGIHHYARCKWSTCTSECVVDARNHTWSPNKMAGILQTKFVQTFTWMNTTVNDWTSLYFTLLLPLLS